MSFDKESLKYVNILRFEVGLLNFKFRYLDLCNGLDFLSSSLNISGRELERERRVK